MNKKSIFSLYKKEMLDILRDKKTIIMMILVPLILYPLMIIGVMMLASNMVEDSVTKTYKIAVIDDTIQTVLADSEKYKFKIIKEYDYSECDEALKNKKIDAYISVKDNVYKINYISSLTDSSNACSMVSQVMEVYKNELIEKDLKEKGLDMQKVLNPISIETSDKATSEESVGSFFGYIVPMLLIISILLGALYPAIDVTAGERERGTLETLMTLPVSKLDMMISKFMAVSTIAVISAVLNIISMTFVTVYMYDSINLYAQNVQSDVNYAVFIPAVLIMVICVIVFAMFSAAVCLCVCLFAKSFKEANNYCTPVLLLFTFGSMASALPNIEFNATTAALPVVNISMLVKEIFVLHYNFKLIMIVLLTNILYSTLAVIVMSKLFDSEEILFGQGLKGTRLFEKRSDMKKNQMPAFGDNVLLFAVILLFLIFFSGKLALSYGLKGVAVSHMCMISITILYAWYIRVDAKRLFSIKVPNILHLLAGILMWIGGMCINNVVTALLLEVFPSMQTTSENLQSMTMSGGFFISLFVIAIIPSFSEEIMFRGFLLGSLKDRMKLAYAVFISAILFGLYHMNMLQFAGGVIVGSLMALAVGMSGSIVVSMLIHFLNNGMGVVMTFYPDLISKVPIISKNMYSFSDMIVLTVVGIISILAGCFLLKK